MANRMVRLARTEGELLAIAMAEMPRHLPPWVTPGNCAPEKVQVLSDTAEGPHRAVRGFVLLRWKKGANIPDIMLRLWFEVKYVGGDGRWMIRTHECDIKHAGLGYEAVETEPEVAR